MDGTHDAVLSQLAFLENSLGDALEALGTCDGVYAEIDDLLELYGGDPIVDKDAKSSVASTVSPRSLHEPVVIVSHSTPPELSKRTLSLRQVSGKEIVITEDVLRADNLTDTEQGSSDEGNGDDDEVSFVDVHYSNDLSLEQGSTGSSASGEDDHHGSLGGTEGGNELGDEEEIPAEASAMPPLDPPQDGGDVGGLLSPTTEATEDSAWPDVGYISVRVNEEEFWELYEQELEKEKSALTDSEGLGSTEDPLVAPVIEPVPKETETDQDTDVPAAVVEPPPTSPTNQADSFDFFNLKVIYEQHKTGFEETKDLRVYKGMLIAGRYEVVKYVGEAAFSSALECLDIVKGGPVCVKVIKNNKDFFDQSLDEIKLLQHVNSSGDPDDFNVLRLYDHFYFKEHLFIVTELLGDNLYELSKTVTDTGAEEYFTLDVVRTISKQLLEALVFVHSLDLIHCDLKPENILIKDLSPAKVKIIDFGSSCFTTDHLTSYIQSRSYRAPEVILGLKYSQKIDIWSLGCVLAELFTGDVLFHNESIQTLLARMIAVLGPIPAHMLENGRNVPKLFTCGYTLFERIVTSDTESDDNSDYLIYYPKETNLGEVLSVDEDREGELFVNFVQKLLSIDPATRPSAREALDHPFLHTK